MLLLEEKIVQDNEYEFHKCAAPNSARDVKIVFHSIIRALNEPCSARLKLFDIFGALFRHKFKSRAVSCYTGSKLTSLNLSLELLLFASYVRQWVLHSYLFCLLWIYASVDIFGLLSLNIQSTLSRVAVVLIIIPQH